MNWTNLFQNKNALKRTEVQFLLVKLNFGSFSIGPFHFIKVDNPNPDNIYLLKVNKQMLDGKFECQAKPHQFRINIIERMENFCQKLTKMSLMK